MITRIATILFCTTTPLALLAQEVTLESPDKFISVDGQIVGFNGVMVRIQSAVGAVSVPASEVICFGEACLTTIANNDFGLTASDFIDVVADASATAPTQDTSQAAGTLQVAFAAPAFGAAYDAAAAAFSVSDDTAFTAEISGDGEIALADPTNGTTLTLASTNDMAAADVLIEAISLNGTAPQEFNNPTGWAVAQSLPYQMLALQSFSVIAAPTAGIDSISLNDLARVYAGEVSNWSQIGGADVAVLPLQLPSTSPLRSEIEALVMAPSGKQIAGNVLTMADEAGISASINQFPGSVSIVTTQGADDALTVPVAGSCGIPVPATLFNVKSGDYPLIRPIMANFRGNSGGVLATEALDFAATDAAQELIAQTGFIAFSVTQQESSIKNSRLGGLLGASLDDAQRAAAAQMFQVLFDADRLSTTFTGGAASGPEGAWNRAMLQSITAAMADPANAGREFVLVGKGKSTSGSEAAIAASAAAAEALRDTLGAVAADVIAAGGITLSTYGFGDVAEVACIDGQVAGADYTRIEIWVR